ncbi:MAG: Asp-tRNA(Asn)/Glu-tRNA(Gln) amidotransferase subunit GatC [candidate division Zixibacteria bacterium]|nr:Asp-tRNA(Asn)/Glu-tRNA(Gln) amidotransferase subunit GatC [candidate division Zixibacteria bacterium]MDD5427162.1 Asp-tRNA(Asn)/Glu-tRNA(Gln) amidotransferase subunit GatC [candidate division Zixibacteria bacterium]
MPISKEQVKHIAGLAHLKLTSREVSRYTKELALILDYFDQLKVVDTEGVEPEKERVGEALILREDKVGSSLTQTSALANASGGNGEYFSVPRVIDK